MTETSTDTQAPPEDGGSLELVRVPAWEAKHIIVDNPDEVVHLVCCRDMDWRKAVCGYEDTEAVIATSANHFCAMCVEVWTSHGTEPGSGTCPFDDQSCPDDDELDRIIQERASR